MQHTSSTNQPFSGDSDAQQSEVEGDPVEDDPELAAIAANLRETASYAINPEFKKDLHEDLLQQFREHHSKEAD